MQINLQGKNLEVTEAVHDYVVKRITNLGKLLSGFEKDNKEVSVYFEVAKTTNHHRAGEVYRADCSVMIDGEKFFSNVNKEDLYEAIDAVKEIIYGEITKHKNKKQALFIRGARKVKDMLKGFKMWKK